MAMPPGHFCPTLSECETDDGCADSQACAKVGCCNPGVEPFVGRCVEPCPTV
jgi:hypothetical protein